MIGEIVRFFIRISAFLRKEVFEILRQPRLVVTLVFGPFLILLLFGLGYRVEAQPIRTMFVMAEDNTFRAHLEEYTTGINPLLLFGGVTDSLSEAQEQLVRGDVDLVVVLPDKPTEKILNSEQAVFELYHNEIDPFQRDYIDAFARIYTNEVNRRVLTQVAERGREESADVEVLADQAQTTAGQMREALEEGDVERALQYRDELVAGAGLVAVSLGTSVQLAQGMEERFGSEADVPIDEIVERLETIRQDLQPLTEIDADQEDFSNEIEQARQIEEEIGTLQELLADFQRISPSVLVSPFRSDVQDVSEDPLRVSDFYVPSAIALLVQHLAVTAAALSIVRERNEGTIELFRVSPISSLETLLGKYLSYFIFDLFLLAILTGLVAWGLQVPMLGSWWNYFLVVGLLIFCSLGLGFIISLIAQTTSQAVQYSMIVLLASIFFSGFFLSLQLLRPAVRVVSWLLPATYATQLLQDNMLRGIFTQIDLVGTLALMGLAFFVLAWLLLRRKMARR